MSNEVKVKLTLSVLEYELLRQTLEEAKPPQDLPKGARKIRKARLENLVKNITEQAKGK